MNWLSCSTLGSWLGILAIVDQPLDIRFSQAQLLANRVEEIEATTGLSASGAASDASKPIYLELEELKEQNARLQIISIIAIILAVLSIMVSISLMIFMMCRNMAASGSPCPNPAMAHLPMKDNGNGQGAEVEDVKVET